MTHRVLIFRYAVFIVITTVLASARTWSQSLDEDGLFVTEEMLIDEVMTDGIDTAVRDEQELDASFEQDIGEDLGMADDFIIDDELLGELTEEPITVEEEKGVPLDSSIRDALVEEPIDDFLIDTEEQLDDEVDYAEIEEEAFQLPPSSMPPPRVNADPGVVEMPVVLQKPAENVIVSRPFVKTPAPGVPRSEVKPDDVVILEETETLRRQAEETHARESFKEAEVALLARDYQKAYKLFNEALQYIGNRRETQIERALIKEGLAECFYRWSIEARKMRDFEKARDRAKFAVSQGHPKAGRLVALIEKDIAKGLPVPRVTPPRRWEVDEYKKTQESVSDFLKTGREYLSTAEYDKAVDSFELALKYDPHNTEAIRLRDKASQKRYDMASYELESTRRDMMGEVRRTWNPRDYGLVSGKTPEQRMDGVSGTADGENERLRIIKKMKDIMIPEIEFRQANINDVVAMLQSYSVEFDESEEVEEKKGVNIILHLGGTGAEQGEGSGRSQSTDIFGDMSSDSSGRQDGGGGTEIPMITFSARYISLLEALDLVTSVADLMYRVRGSVVMIVSKNAPPGPIIHRMYDVLPSLSTKVATMGTGSSSSGGRDDFRALESDVTYERREWQEFFVKLGVPFPTGASVDYVPAIGKLVVANTSDNLAILEEILAVMNVVPHQIEIEARFVEVSQIDFDALGVEWLLSDDWELAQKKGQENLPLGARQRMKMDANAQTGGFTMGNRFVRDLQLGAEGIPVADGILSLATVLTNPELRMILHLLEQKGNADLLSAPKVTTRSGSEATIKVVEEYIYPTEFEVTEVTGRDQFGNATIIGGIVEPGAFETREVGVILQVTPEVSTETAGSMIDLSLAPQVVTEPRWKNYGTVYTDQNGNEQQLNMEQPFFHTREIITQISIYNGATVVMGGMINERRVSVDDKVPFLGDLPLIGRLFRSTYDKSEKRNLLIFVTARLVDPAGKPLGAKTTLDTVQAGSNR